jgi:hypothetical protein
VFFFQVGSHANFIFYFETREGWCHWKDELAEELVLGVTVLEEAVRCGGDLGEH